MLNQADVHFASRVAFQSLRVVILITCAAILAFVVERYIFEQTIATSWKNIGEISDARAAILLADEQLTMSAFAYAQTSEARWKERYRQSMMQFEIAVDKARNLSEITIRKEFDATFVDAHQTMQSLEQLVIDLIDNNERADATNVFSSPRYIQNKDKLTASINTLLQKADNQAQTELQRVQKRALILIGIFIILTTAGLIWLSRRLKAAMSKAETTFEHGQQAYIDQLSINHAAKLKQSRMEQMGALTATMAHELRNPLGAVRTSTFMLDRLWPERDERVSRAFERINTGVERCDTLITQLLDFSKLGPATKQSIDFDNWLEVELHELAKTLNASIELTCLLGVPNKVIEFDPDQMKSAFSKVLTNASEAMISRAGAAETSDKRPPLIQIATEHNNNRLTVVFKDNGRGIRPEHLSKLTEPFFTTKNFGAGLGLATVQQIVEQHDGSIEITNSETGGAIVKISLLAA
jgi:signal transduction histidine kinase